MIEVNEKGVVGTLQIHVEESEYTIKSAEYMDPFFSPEQRTTLLLLDLLQAFVYDEKHHLEWLRNLSSERAKQLFHFSDPPTVEAFRTMLQDLGRYLSARRFLVFEERKEYQADFEENGGIHSRTEAFLETRALFSHVWKMQYENFSARQAAAIEKVEERARRKEA